MWCWDSGWISLFRYNLKLKINRSETALFFINIFVEFVRPPAPAPAPPPPPPPPTCPSCPTTPAPPPSELQCPACTCIPLFYDSDGYLKPDEQSNYSCSKARFRQIFGISRTFNNYQGALSCPTECFADCGNTYHCCDTPPPPATTATEQCIPSTARVILDNGQSATMSQLQIGDRVQTGINMGKFPFLQVKF